MFAFLVSILFLIKRQKKRNKNSIIRFKQISSSVPDKNRSRYDWIRNWTLNRNRQINFSKLNQNDEDEEYDDDSGGGGSGGGGRSFLWSLFIHLIEIIAEVIL